MLKSLTIGLLLFCCIPSTALAQDNDFGLGIILGEPTGFCGKLWLNRRSAVDGAVAWSFVNTDHLHLHGDYLWHNYDIIEVEEGKLPIYYGIGVRIRFEGESRHIVHSTEDKSRFGVRGVFGIEYIFATTPFDLFFELAPIMDLIPGCEFSPSAALGFRYFF